MSAKAAAGATGEPAIFTGAFAGTTGAATLAGAGAATVLEAGPAAVLAGAGVATGLAAGAGAVLAGAGAVVGLAGAGMAAGLVGAGATAWALTRKVAVPASRAAKSIACRTIGYKMKTEKRIVGRRY